MSLHVFFPDVDFRERKKICFINPSVFTANVY